MPTSVKFVLSLAVIAIGAACTWLEMVHADETVAIVIAALTAFMLIALWLFPEAGVKDGEQQTD